MSKLRSITRLGRSFAAGEAFIGSGAVGIAGTVGAARMAVIGSPSVLASGYLQRTFLRSARRTVITFIELQRGEPVLDQLGQIIGDLTKFRPDWIMAAGGGAVLDTAKLCWALYEHPDLANDLLIRPFSLPPLRAKAKFIAAPTTNGSGSEASSIATFQFAPGDRKSFLVSHELLPDIALLDPELARDVSPLVIASSGFDALSHAIEGYTSAYASELTDPQALGAAICLLRGLEKAVLMPDDLRARAAVMAASYHAGAVQNLATPGIGHAIAHQLSAHGIAHAHATGSLLGPALLFNARASVRPNALADALGFKTVTDLVKRIEELKLSIGVPQLDAALLERLSEDVCFLDGVLGDPCSRANPTTLDRATVKSFLQSLPR